MSRTHRALADRACRKLDSHGIPLELRDQERRMVHQKQTRLARKDVGLRVEHRILGRRLLYLARGRDIPECVAGSDEAKE